VFFFAKIFAKTKNPDFRENIVYFRENFCPNFRENSTLEPHTPSPINATAAVSSKNGINCDSAGNYYLMDKESTGGKVFLSGITSSWMRSLRGIFGQFREIVVN
jgi:hypothetical protein